MTIPTPGEHCPDDSPRTDVWQPTHRARDGPLKAPRAAPRGTQQRARDANIATDAIWPSWPSSAVTRV